MAEYGLAAMLERGAALDRATSVDEDDFDGRWVADWVPPFAAPIPGLDHDDPAAPDAAANDAGPFSWPSLKSGSAWGVDPSAGDRQHESIRVATINCEKKLGQPQNQLALAAWATDRHLDVVAITEPGLVANPWVLAQSEDQPWHVFGRHLVDRFDVNGSMRVDPATAVLLVIATCMFISCTSCRAWTERAVQLASSFVNRVFFKFWTGDKFEISSLM